ncbi:MAG: hypothetical protein RLZZ66_1099 [Pseudomonadota bacterium]|jgi:hypothetical protein
MNESKFIASIYQEQKSNEVPQTIYQGFRKIDPLSMYKNSLSAFPLYRVAARLEKNPKVSEQVLLAEKYELHHDQK